MELIQKIAELEKRFPISKIGNDVFSARLIMEGLSEGGLRFLSRTPTGIYFEATMPQNWTPHLDGIDLETPSYWKERKIHKALEEAAQEFNMHVRKTNSGFAIRAAEREIAEVHPNYLLFNRSSASLGGLSTYSLMDRLLEKLAAAAYSSGYLNSPS